MSLAALWQNRRWQVVVPPKPLTDAQLALIDRSPDETLDASAAAELLDAYRRSRSALWSVCGSRGFRIGFTVNWQPDAAGIGEPDPIESAPRVVQVFGRRSGDTSPSRLMAVPRSERSVIDLDEMIRTALAAALAEPEMITVPAPSDSDCDGCRPDVLTTQERWRDHATRVIRPRHVVIDSQVIVLPLRHVLSLGDLAPAEVLSIHQQLGRVRTQFQLASGATGLNCFANDGTAARQETAHVHLHVFGRSQDEPANPFELLAGPSRKP
ncbi:hypothetical protein GCM10011575_44970 [Microlunatus endophyticus]|uniref:HIT domain-containing protein n=1 Tax=Microlunatus endophyticus TaxID=1716077 RepID=A0A917SI17_9ACTN|nr:HIT domain-containing protein [Microlunatus endophyticus]GGL81687.1 hypothetical protein GCM10011575_44970 [Microlunatus endophyticus]